MIQKKEIKIFIEGKDMSDQIGIISAVHDTYAGDYVDTLTASLQDKDGTWSKWRPKTGEKIELNFSTAKTGVMFIHKITSMNGVYEIVARSIPPFKNSVQKREWKNASFSMICQTIASDLGLTLETYGTPDPTYEQVHQLGEKNTAFLSRICHCEGCDMLAFNEKLVVYDKAQMESQQSKLSYDFTGKGDFTFSRNDGLKAGKVIVARYKKENDWGRSETSTTEHDWDWNERILYQGEASSGEGRTIVYKDLLPTSDAECTRWAGNLLKKANEKLSTGKFTLNLTPELAAGSVITIQNSRATEWNGNVFLYHVRHDYQSTYTTLYFRKI